jgi:hypothetical protein
LPGVLQQRYWAKTGLWRSWWKSHDGDFGGQHVRPLVSLQWQIPCSSVDVQSFDNHKFFHVKEHFHKGPATGSFGGGSVGRCLMSAKTMESSWSKASRSTAKLSS